MVRKIYDARMQAGLTQKEVAKKLGVKQPTVSNWESGKTRPTVGMLYEIAKMFHVTMDSLMG